MPDTGKILIFLLFAKSRICSSRSVFANQSTLYVQYFAKTPGSTINMKYVLLMKSTSG